MANESAPYAAARMMARTIAPRPQLALHHAGYAACGILPPGDPGVRPPRRQFSQRDILSAQLLLMAIASGQLTPALRKTSMNCVDRTPCC